MSLENAECCDIYGTDPGFMLENGYAEIGGIQLVADPDGSSAQRCILFPANLGQTGTGFRYVLQTATAKVGVALRLWMGALPANTGQRPPIIMWSDANNVEIARVQVETTGRLSIVRGDSVVLGTTVSPVITAVGWWHIEAFIDVVSDTAQIRVEGVEKLALTGCAFPGTAVYQTSHRTDGDNTSAYPAQYMKDICWWNGLGTENNDFLGSVQCLNLLPNSDVDLGDWVPITGTQAYPILDNNPPDDAIYLSADVAAVDAPMVVGLTDLPADVSSVRGIVTFVRAEKNDGGDGNIQVSVISGAMTGDGEDRPITAAPIYWKDVFELDPNTSAPWTPGAVDLAELQINRTV